MAGDAERMVKGERTEGGCYKDEFRIRNVSRLMIKMREGEKDDEEEHFRTLR